MYEKTVASSRYVRRFMPLMGAYIALLFLTEWIVARYRPAGLSLYMLALLPAAPLVGIIVIIGLYLKEEGDEICPHAVGAHDAGRHGLHAGGDDGLGLPRKQRRR